MASSVEFKFADGDAIVDTAPETKLFEDFKARPGDCALITMHTIPFEGSVGLVNMLTATRLRRKGYEVAFLLYGPAVLMGVATRGFPKVGQEAFPGNLVYRQRLEIMAKEGIKIYACRFAMSALYGIGDDMMLPFVTPVHMHDVLDMQIYYQRRGALIMSTWTV